MAKANEVRLKLPIVKATPAPTPSEAAQLEARANREIAALIQELHRRERDGTQGHAVSEGLPSEGAALRGSGGLHRRPGTSRPG